MERKYSMEKRLNDKISIVTGSAKGIGKGVAARLASEGATVVVADLDIENAEKTAREIRETVDKAISYYIDLLNVKEIKKMVAKIVEKYGRLDIMVNAAGTVENKPFLQIDEEGWDRIIDINQKATVFCIQGAAEQMIKQIPKKVIESGRADKSYGKIVNFSSISGRSGRPLQVHYAAAKAAVINITKSAALAFAQYNINVNAISPSVVITAMVRQLFKDQSKIFNIDEKTAERKLLSKIPLKRPGTVEDMAKAVSFLCSSDSDYITGQTLNVDGGFEMN